MNKKERTFIAIVLLGIILMVGLDLFTDAGEGVRWWHLLSEAVIALSAMLGIFILIRDTFQLKQSLEEERRNVTQMQVEAEKWRMQSKKYLDGLSQAIDSQLVKWGLSASEKEVAFLLLKGLSLKEIADLRQTTEKTARAQSMAIYSKAGLAGRSELAAFFLEDLLPSSETSQSENHPS